MKFKYILLILLILIIVCTVVSLGMNNSIIYKNETNISQEESVEIVYEVIQKEISNSKPTYTPILRRYDIDKSDDIWHAKTPSSYITPDNEWVKYYANEYQKYIDGKESDYPQINYVEDKHNSNYPQNYDNDYWQNADYTFYTGQGDCEDAAIAWASIHRSMGHKTIVVSGELWFNDGSPNIRDFWYEWIDDDNLKNIKFFSSSSVLREKEFVAVPKYMFNDRIIWSDYNEIWYK